MYVGCDALHGVFSDRQTFLFKGVCSELSVRRRVLNRFVTQTYTQTNPRPSGQRSDNPSTWRCDGSIGGNRFFFSFQNRHFPSE